MPRPNLDIGLFEHPEKRVEFKDQKIISEKKSSINIRELIRLEISPRIENSKQVAKQFVAAERAPERRTVMHSGIQNRLIRARFSGLSGFSAREIMREVATMMPDKNFSQDVDRMFIGVDSAIRSIQKDQKLFQQFNRPGEFQQICFDDELDAHHAIDYLDIRFKQDEDGEIVSVDEIRLVQVKTREISDEEREKIIRSHQEYVRRLFSKTEVTRLKRFRAVEHIRSGHIFDLESYRGDLSKVEIAEKIFNDFFDVILELVDTTDKAVTEECVINWQSKYGFARTDFFVFASLLSGEKTQNEIAKYLFDMLGLDLLKETKMQSALNQWVNQVDSDTIDLSGLSPKSEFTGKIISGAAIVSVLHHGGMREEIPLSAVSDKAIRLVSRP